MICLQIYSRVKKTLTLTIIQFRNLGIEFGLKQSRVSELVKELRNYIFEHDDWLNMMRNLHLDRYTAIISHTFNFMIICRNLRELLNEAHNATLLNPRATAAFQGLPQPGQKLGKSSEVGACYDLVNVNYH